MDGAAFNPNAAWAQNGGRFGGVLSDIEILRALRTRPAQIAIFPFREKCLRTASYDIVLGAEFYREAAVPSAPAATAVAPPKPLLNPYSKRAGARLWGAAPSRAEPVSDLRPEDRATMLDPAEGETALKPTDEVIILQPNEAILAHSDELIGTRNGLVAVVYQRSSWMRSLVEVMSGGWGEVGFRNKVTLIIRNLSRKRRVALVVGRRIATVAFHVLTGNIAAPIYGSGTSPDKYMPKTRLDDLYRSWPADAMLPKLSMESTEPSWLRVKPEDFKPTYYGLGVLPPLGPSAGAFTDTQSGASSSAAPAPDANERPAVPPPPRRPRPAPPKDPSAVPAELRPISAGKDRRPLVVPMEYDPEVV